MNCLACHAPTTNGLALCDLCQRKASTDLEFLPVYFRNLARWRPGRAGSRPVPGSRVLYDGEVRSPDSTGDRISDRLDEALNVLTTWVRMFIDDRGEFAQRPLTFAEAAMMGELPEEMGDDKAILFSSLCSALDHHLVSVATLEWAGELIRDLAKHESRLRALTSLVPGWYAGSCRRQLTMDDRCGSPTYVMPGLTWVTCAACGSTTYARDHLDVILSEARGWLARPKALAEALVALMDTEPSVPRLYTRIRQWAHQGDLVAEWRTQRDYEWSDDEKRLIVTDQPTGFARYRLGDVFDLATRRHSGIAKESQAS